MIYSLILLSFAASSAVALILRYMDRHELRQIRRQSNQHHSQLETTADERIRAIDDATIDFEMKVHQARSTRDEMTALIESTRGQIESLKEDSQIITQVQSEIHQLADEAKEVNHQVHLLETGLDRVGRTRVIIDGLEKRTAELADSLHSRGEEVRERLEEILNQIITEARGKTRDFVEKENQLLRDLHSRHETITRGVDDESHQLDLLHERISSLQNQIDEKIALETVKIEERFSDTERRFHDRFQSMDSGLIQIRETAVKSMRDEIERIRTELDNFNLEAIASRDEIINDTRRMATGLVDQIDGFQSKFLAAENKLSQLIEAGKADLGNTYDELSEAWQSELKLQTEKMRSSLTNINDEIEQLRRDYSDQIQTVKSEKIGQLTDAGENLRDQLTAHADDLKSDLTANMAYQQEDFEKVRESFLRIKSDIEERIDGLEDQIREVSRVKQRIQEVADRSQNEIVNKKHDLIEELETRAGRFLEEQDQKLGQLNNTIDEKISRQLSSMVDRGQIQLDEIERRTSDTIRRSIETMEQELTKARNEFAGIRAEVQNETEKGRELRDSIIKEIHEDHTRLRKFEEKLSLVETAEQLALQLDEAVSTLSGKMTEAKDERIEMEQFFGKLEGLRDIRQNLENEMRHLSERRALLDGTEERFGALNHQIQELEVRFATVEGADRVIERIEDRMLKFDEYRKSFEEFFRDLAERRKYFETTLHAVEKSKKEAAESASTAREFLGQLERIDMRKDTARQEIEGLEKRVAGLQHMDREFQKVEARFEQMETLLTDLEQKQDQIATMSKKIGEIAKQSDFMRGELESLLQEAGEKMDRLSAFYETVDQMVHEADRATKTDTGINLDQPASAAKRKSTGLADYKKEGILSLYVNHKWEPELIAERLKIDVATVRTVIGAYKHANPV